MLRGERMVGLAMLRCRIGHINERLRGIRPPLRRGSDLSHLYQVPALQSMPGLAQAKWPNLLPQMGETIGNSKVVNSGKAARIQAVV